MLQNLLNCLFWIIIVFFQTSKCRRYDIEQEAQNLYSTDFKTVIERFRRTPEYLKILNDQIALLSKNKETILKSTISFYSIKLEQKITEIFGGNETQNLRTLRQFQFRKIIPRPRRKYRRRRKQNKVKSLDNYKKFQTSLSLEQRNRMKELGFEFAGGAIHAMLNHLAPDGAISVSTLLPDGGEMLATSTTIIHHDHEVTQLTSPNTEATHSESTHHHHTYTTVDQSQTVQ